MNEEQIKRITELLNQLKQLSKDTGIELPKIFRNIDLDASNASEQVQNFVKSFAGIEDAASEIRVQMSEIRTIFSEVDINFNDIAGSIRATLDEITGGSESYNKALSSIRSIQKISQQIAKDQQGEIQLSISEINKLQENLKSNVKELETGDLSGKITELEGKLKSEGAPKEGTKARRELEIRLQRALSLQEFITAETLKQEGIESSLNKTLEKRLELRKKEEGEIKQAEGFTGVAVESSQEVLQTVGLGSLSKFIDLEGIREKVREESKNLVGKSFLSKFLGQTNIAFKTLGRVGAGALKSLINPVTLVSFALKGLVSVLSTIKNILFDIDEQAGQIAKQFNITYQEAVALRSELAQAAIATEDIFVNSQSLQKSLSTINQITGTRVLSGLGSNLQQNVVFLTQLAERAGLAEDAIARIAQVSFSTGVSAEDLVSTLTAQVELRNLNEDQLFNEKAIFDEISKLSSATLLSLSQYPTQISDAFFDAKLLGLELSKVDNIAAGFTDFGSSIRTELEAIVVTGKQLNLNAARFYALNNDTAGVAREISKQIGTSAEFANMNRIAQESLAKAFNMSRDEVADILLIQDQLLGLSEREATAREKELTALRATVGEQRFRQAIEEKNVDRLLEQVSITDRFTASIARIKDALIPLLTPLTSIVNSLAYVLEGIPKALSGIKSFGEGVGTFFGNVVDSFKELFRQISEGIEAFQNNTIVKGISSFLPTTLSVQEAINRRVESENAKEVDDAYFPSMGMQKGYDRTLLTPEGTFKINNEDSIIAGTDDSLKSIPERRQAVPRQPVTGTTQNIINREDISNIKNLVSENISENINNKFTSISERLRQPVTGVTETIVSNNIQPTNNVVTSPVTTQNITNTSAQETKIDMSELVSTMKKSNELIEQQTKVLAQGQEAIRKQKQNLVVGATSLGTQINTNSYRVQFG